MHDDLISEKDYTCVVGWEEPGYISLTDFARAIYEGIVEVAKILNLTKSNPLDQEEIEQKFAKKITEYSVYNSVYHPVTGDIFILPETALNVGAHNTNMLDITAQGLLMIRKEVSEDCLTGYKQLAHLSDEKRYEIVANYLKENFWPMLRGEWALKKLYFTPPPQP